MRSKSWIVALIFILSSLVLTEPVALAGDADAAWTLHPAPSWGAPEDPGQALDAESPQRSRPYKSSFTSGMLTMSTTLAAYSLFGFGVILLNDGVSEELAVTSMVLGGAGALVAPSAGHMYSGAWRHTGWFIGGRALCLLAVPLFSYPAPALSVFVGAGFVVLSVYDLIDAFLVPDRMRRRARMHQSALLPTLVPIGQGKLVPGLVWTGRF